MNHEDLDRVLEQGLAGEPAGALFRVRVLQGSLAALARRRRRQVRWRIATLSAAAVLIAGVAFLGGRYSVLRWETGAPPGAPPGASGVRRAGGAVDSKGRTPGPSAAGPVARAEGTVAVPGELIEWVNAARLFKQLGMPERVGRALDHVGRLMPADTARSGAVFAGGVEAGAGQEERAEEAERQDGPESWMPMNRVVAHSLGD
jgi:hypothetical protein